ncbi:ROK family protein [Shigella flexneri]
MQREVRLANDANCLAVSEAVDGAAAGAQTGFAVIIGTDAARAWHSMGGAYRRQWHGRRVGTQSATLDGRDELRYREEVPCYCGKQGCIRNLYLARDLPQIIVV